uniref:Uncharacterized protein n=1 Tax=Solanum tuberosum TaxID=4113 RepID=M1DAK0_SOLTU
MKATVVLHLGWWSAGSSSRTLPRPVIKTTTHGGLRGLMLELGKLCLIPLAFLRLMKWSMTCEGLCGTLLLGLGVNHRQVDGPWFLSWCPNHEPYHDSCEGPRTLKATVVLQFGWWSAGSGSRTLPRPVILTTTRRGLPGLMPEIGRFCIVPTSLPKAREVVHVP